MKKIHILVVASILLFSGCQFGKSQLIKPSIDSSLPTIDAQSIKYISDINGIVFEWQPINDPRVKGYRIFRNKYTGSRKKLFEVGSVDGRYSSHFYDKGLKGNSSYSYRFAAIGEKNSRSTASDIVKVRTLPSLEEVSFLSSISDLPNRVKIYWRPHNSHRVNGYIIYRADEFKQNWNETKKVEGRLNAEYVDHDLLNKKTYKYKILATTFDGLRSVQSKITTATTKAVPQIIKNVKATKEVAKRVELSWDSTKDSIGEEIEYYTIYSSSDPHYNFKAIAKSNANAYIDMINKDGITRYYKISATDSDGLTSEQQKSATLGSTRRAPEAPVVTSAKIDGNKAVITWVSKDDRAVAFTVVKKVKSQKWYKKDEIEYITDIKGDTFVDNKITAGIVYRYSVMSVDEFEVQSRRTKDVSILLPQRPRR